MFKAVDMQNSQLNKSILNLLLLLIHNDNPSFKEEVLKFLRNLKKELSEEKKRINEEKKNSVENLRIYEVIANKFHRNLKNKELLHLCDRTAEKYGLPPLTRDEKRKKILMYEYLERYYETTEPYIISWHLINETGEDGNSEENEETDEDTNDSTGEQSHLSDNEKIE